MKNIVALLALLISLGLVVYLYMRLSAVEQELAVIQRRAADCEQVTFQLQNQLSAERREHNAEASRPARKGRE